MHRLHILRLCVAVIDDAATGLNIQGFILDNGRAQRDAHVHVAACAKVANTAAVQPAFLGLQLVDNLHRADFGCT